MELAAAQLPPWVQTYAAVGGASLLSGMLSWFTGFRLAAANTRKANAEAAKYEGEARTEAIRVEAARGEFEKALNERTSMVMKSMEGQIQKLSGLVDEQNKQLKAQSEQISRMEWEIRDLRNALNEKTEYLHQLQIGLASEAGSMNV